MPLLTLINNIKDINGLNLKSIIRTIKGDLITIKDQEWNNGGEIMTGQEVTENYHLPPHTKINLHPYSNLRFNNKL